MSRRREDQRLDVEDVTANSQPPMMTTATTAGPTPDAYGRELTEHLVGVDAVQHLAGAGPR